MNCFLHECHVVELIENLANSSFKNQVKMFSLSQKKKKKKYTVHSGLKTQRTMNRYHTQILV